MNGLEKFLIDKKMEYKRDVSFKDITTYKCGGVASFVVYPANEDDVVSLLKFLKDNKIKFKIFGNGSNILASDKKYDGVIIKLSKLNSLEIDGTTIKVGAGFNLSVLANTLSNKGFSGLEFACGIPGTVGGAIYMNAGAYLKDMASVTIKVICLDNDLNIVYLDNKDMHFSYRKSILSENGFICLGAILELEYGNQEEISTLVKERMQRRITSQPLEFPSAGSVFRNPEGLYAGKLIEDLNLKGLEHGGAYISDKHANFIVNKNNAKSSDVKYLMDLVQNKVKEEYDVDLHREQELFNWE